MKLISFILFLLIASPTAFCAADAEKPAEKAGEKVDKATDKTAATTEKPEEKSAEKAAAEKAALEKTAEKEAEKAKLATIPVLDYEKTNSPATPLEFDPKDLNPPAPHVDVAKEFEIQLDTARDLRRAKQLTNASMVLVALLKSNAPVELKRPALYELALVTQEDGQPVKAQQIFSQYVHTYPSDPTVPEVILRQGLLYRQMGVNTLAVSKFYAVMSTALKLKLDNMDYYKKLVLQAQTEIAETYYLEGKFDEASDFFARLLKSTGLAEVSKPQIQYKLVRSLSFGTNHAETVARSQVFLDTYTNLVEVPEVRFLLASTLKKLGRNQEAMKQVLVLLQSQQANVSKNPEVWTYWQQRAGNDIANQLYKEGDYFSALQIYLSLAELNNSPAWQLPVWYQAALVYEQLQQWQKAGDMYARIVARQKELTDPASNPSLASIFEMAKWRKEYITWMQTARANHEDFQPHYATTNSAPAAVQK